ncbi:MAG: hypothetical protein JNK21_10535 [Rhodospirillaceae bacterium]|nr:hypothetical protein [Rhodospirillaceae bacterium]
MSNPLFTYILSSRWTRNLLAVAVTAGVTFLIFRGVAAFNDVLKMYNAMPVAQPYTCPNGYVLVTLKDGRQDCVPAPSDTKGVVPVGLYQRPPAAQKPATQKPVPAKPTPEKPAATPP